MSKTNHVFQLKMGTYKQRMEMAWVFIKLAYKALFSQYVQFAYIDDGK